MTNNDILRRLRYAFDFKDSSMVDIFALAEFKVSRDQLLAWFKKDDEDGFVAMKDVELAAFLNGLISFKRGKRDGPVPTPESRLTNNQVLQKLRIALNLKADDVIGLFELAGLPLSHHELSAFFRKPGHKNYRECKDQMLRNFLLGIQLKHRPTPQASSSMS